MDALVKAAVEKVTESVESLPWDAIEEARNKNFYRDPIGPTISESVAKAIHSVDALKSALKAVW